MHGERVGGGFVEVVVEGEKPEVVVFAPGGDRGGELYGIVSTEGVPMREVSGEPGEALGDGNPLAGGPFLVQRSNDVGVLLLIEAPLSQEPGERCPSLRVGNYGGRYA